MFSLSNAEELRQKAVQSQQAQEAKQGSPASDPDKSNTKDSPDKKHDTKVSGAGESEKTSNTPPAVGEGGGRDGGVEEGTGSAMSPEQIEEFFKATIERLTSQEEREAIKAKVTKETRIPAILIQIQHDQLGKMGVGREEGQDALNRYSRIIATADEETRRKMETFTHTCQRTYIEVLREIQPEEEENEAKLSPDQIMEFFEACDTLLALPETRENLRKEFLETEVPPDETIVGMQRSMLRTLGFNADHGVACLNDFPKDYPDDFKLQMRLRQFIQCATMARQEAVLGKEEMTKRMQMHQAMVMKEQKMAIELNALDDAGKKELRRRVSEMQRKHALAVVTLKTKEERMAYVKGIPPEEQWEISKLKMLTMQEQAARGGGQCPHQAHGAPFMRHGFGPMGGPQGGHGERSQGQEDGASKK